MKKYFSVLLTIILLSMFIPVCSASSITVYMNNEKINFDVEPVIVNGRTMVPMRAIFEKLGAEVSWNAETNTATAYRSKPQYKYVAITIGSMTMNIHNDIINLDAPAMITNGRTLIPLRAVSEAFDCEVKWDGDTKTINIYSNDFIDFSKETAAVTEVYASSPIELLNAIGSNKKIILTSNYYNLSKLPVINNEYIEKTPYSDGYIIKNVINMTIEGTAEIVIDDIYADVLCFINCGKITLSGLTAGHTESLDSYACEGAVTRFLNCDNITLENCNLYGCGAFGINADNVKNLTVNGGRIYDCSYTGIWLTNSEANIKGTEFSDSVHESGFLRIDNSKITLTNCRIHDIICNGFGAFISTIDWAEETSDIVINNSIISKNTFDTISDAETSTITFNNCTFNNNSGNMMHPNVSYNNKK